jgi:hypothetical protein
MTELEKAIYHILAVWSQYGGEVKDRGCLCFSHDCMSSGADAADFLSRHGYGLDVGMHVALTTKGLTLLGKDPSGIREDSSFHVDSYDAAESAFCDFAKSYFDLGKKHLGIEIDFKG